MLGRQLNCRPNIEVPALMPCILYCKLVISNLKFQIEPLSLHAMPRHELKLPDLGIDDQPITVSAWFVKQGTRVSEDDPIVEVLCGGATVDLPAGVDGILIEKSAAEDEPLEIGQTLAVLETLDE
jgi:hypothetical protein